MNEETPAPKDSPKTGKPIVPTTKPGPGLPGKVKPALREAKVHIHAKNHAGVTADVLAEIGQSEAPKHLKDALAAEIAASGCRGASVDIHRHEIDGPKGKTIIIHATVTPLFNL